MTVSCLSKDTLHQVIGNAACVTIEPTPYVSNVQVVTLATASCYENNHQHHHNKNKNKNRRKVIDVYGQQIEPICNYRRCKHKFQYMAMIAINANVDMPSIML
jgi:hypothetical protein